MADEYLKASAAREWLGLSRSRLYKLVEEGRIGRKIGGVYMFTVAELDEYKKTRNEKGGRPAKKNKKRTAGTTQEDSVKKQISGHADAPTPHGHGRNWVKQSRRAYHTTAARPS